MQLHIRHETLYRHGEPVKHSIQNLRLIARYVGHYLDGCPIWGVRGGGLESMRGEVTVAPSAQQQQQQQQ